MAVDPLVHNFIQGIKHHGQHGDLGEGKGLKPGHEVVHVGLVLAFIGLICGLA